MSPETPPRRSKAASTEDGGCERKVPSQSLSKTSSEAARDDAPDASGPATEAEHQPEIDCQICLEPLRSTESITQLNPCGHPFHTECIKNWEKCLGTKEVRIRSPGQIVPRMQQVPQQMCCPTCRSVVPTLPEPLPLGEVPKMRFRPQIHPGSVCTVKDLFEDVQYNGREVVIREYDAVRERYICEQRIIPCSDVFLFGPIGWKARKVHNVMHQEVLRKQDNCNPLLKVKENNLTYVRRVKFTLAEVQSLLDQAEPGDRVCVPRGEYFVRAAEAGLRREGDAPSPWPGRLGNENTEDDSPPRSGDRHHMRILKDPDELSSEELSSDESCDPLEPSFAAVTSRQAVIQKSMSSRRRKFKTYVRDLLAEEEDRQRSLYGYDYDGDEEQEEQEAAAENYTSGEDGWPSITRAELASLRSASGATGSSSSSSSSTAPSGSDEERTGIRSRARRAGTTSMQNSSYGTCTNSDIGAEASTREASSSSPSSSSSTTTSKTAIVPLGGNDVVERARAEIQHIQSNIKSSAAKKKRGDKKNDLFGSRGSHARSGNPTPLGKPSGVEQQQQGMVEIEKELRTLYIRKPVVLVGRSPMPESGTVFNFPVKARISHSYKKMLIGNMLEIRNIRVNNCVQIQGRYLDRCYFKNFFVTPTIGLLSRIRDAQNVKSQRHALLLEATCARAAVIGIETGNCENKDSRGSSKPASGQEAASTPERGAIKDAKVDKEEIREAEKIIFEDCYVRGGQDGLHISDQTAACVLRRVTIEETRWKGLTTRAPVVIEDSAILDCDGGGIYCEDRSLVTMKGKNHIQRTGDPRLPDFSTAEQQTTRIINLPFDWAPGTEGGEWRGAWRHGRGMLLHLGKAFFASLWDCCFADPERNVE